MLKKWVLGLMAIGLLCSGCTLLKMERIQLPPKSQITGELEFIFHWQDRQISMGTANFDTKQYVDNLGGEIFSFSYTLRNEHFSMNIGISEMPLVGGAHIWIGGIAQIDEHGHIKSFKGSCEVWGQLAHMPAKAGTVLGFPTKIGGAQIIKPKVKIGE